MRKQKRHILQHWHEFIIAAYVNFLHKAVEFFEAMHDAFLVEVSIRDLKHENAATRKKAAECLACLRDPGAFQALINALEDHNPAVRANAAEALGKLGKEMAVDPLLKLFEHDTTPYVRCCAAEALGKLGEVRAMDALCTVFQENRNGVQWVADQILGDRGGTRTIRMVKHALSKDHECIREQAAWALGEIGDSRAVDVLIIALDDEFLPVRRNAVEALGKIADSRAVKPLCRLFKERDVFIRQEAIHVLGKIGDQTIVDSLFPALHDQHPEIRSETAEALGKIGDSRAVEPLISLLEREHDWYVRGEAAEALRKLHDPKALEPLSRALVNDEHWFVRATAVRFLRTLGDRRAVPPLITALQDEDKDIRKGAEKALITIGLAGKKELVHGLTHKEANIRLHVALILGKIGWAPESLAQKIHYWAGRRRWNAIASAGTLAIKPLMRFLRDRDPAIREEAAAALENIYVSIEIVVFGQKRFQGNRKRTIQNLDVSKPVLPKPSYKQSLQVHPSSKVFSVGEFTIPMSQLKQIIIDAESYDFKLVERFITYAVNHIGQRHLKQHVDVLIYGDPDTLHPNLKNVFENLCKQVTFHS